MGRPCKYKSPAELQTKVDEYFATEEGINNPTVCGLSLYLDFDDYKSLLEYQGVRHEKRVLGGFKKEFAHIISRAKRKIMLYLEKAAMRERGSCQGIIHRMRVMGFDAPQQIDQTIKRERKIVYWKPRKTGRKDKKK